MNPRQQKGESELILRGVAILTVVGVHFLAGLPAVSYTASQFQPITILMDQLSRISVPIFVAISGFGLTLKYQDQAFHWIEFWRRRVLKLLPLYVIWSLIFYLVFSYIPQWRAASVPQSFITQLLTGKADYQLYFVPMIFQLYLLFPLLLKLLAKKPTIILSLVFLFQIGVFAFYSLTADPDNYEQYLLSDQQQYVLSISWVFYFVLGMYLAKKQAFLRSKKFFAWLALALGLVAVGWATVTGLQQINGGLDPIIALRFTRWPILVYASSALVFLLIYRRATVGLPKMFKRPMLFLGQHAYGIYLSHTLFLRILFSVL